MEQPVTFIRKKQIERTVEALKKHQMDAVLLPSKTALIDYVQNAVDANAVVSVGGSMTLFETGLIDHLDSGRYTFLNRYKPGLDAEAIRRLYIQSFDADVYFSSANAITEDGLIYNVDGNGNRVAAITYGPKQVFIIAGTNKIVPTLDDAIKRNETLAAPANAVRLGTKTPCKTTGKCEHCSSPERICCSYSVIGYQRQSGRIKVLFVDEPLGF
ncbi:lactate utilization protein [Fusibacter sp. JL298sf-3]